MKVLLVATIDNYGAPKSFITLCVYLKKMRIDVEAVVNKKNEKTLELERNGIKVYYVKFGHNTKKPELNAIKGNLIIIIKEILYYLADIRLYFIIKKEKYDIVHVNSAVIDVATKPAKRLGVKVVRHLREFVKEDFNRTFYNEKRTILNMNNADCLVAVSPAIKNKYSGLVNKEKIQIVYNGIDENDFNNGERELFNGTRVIIAMVGQLVQGKGHIELLESLQYLDECIDGIEIHIWGDGIEKYKLQKYIEESHLEKTVILEGYSNNIPRVLENTDICVVSSRMEAFGRATIEAMMAGCLVIGANTGGTLELIGDKYGLLYQCGNPEDLAKKIKLAIDNKELMRNIAIKARRHARECFTARNNAKEILHIYSKLLGVIE